MRSSAAVLVRVDDPFPFEQDPKEVADVVQSLQSYVNDVTVPVYVRIQSAGSLHMIYNKTCAFACIGLVPTFELFPQHCCPLKHYFWELSLFLL